jgi:hypothetical protein
VFGDLQQTLDSQLAAKGAVLTVRLDQWPLDVPDRNLPHTRVSGAAAAAVDHAVLLTGSRWACRDPA